MSDPSVHRHTWDMIPWIVNGSASEEQLAGVRSHLQQCADCREELAYQSRLQEAMHARVLPAQVRSALDEQAGWQSLQARIASGRPSATGERVHRAGRGWMPWVLAAMIVESVLLGAVSAALWSGAAPVYHTLSAGEIGPAAATIRMVLAPSMTIAQVQRLLHAARMQAVGGPSAAGVWSLASAPAAGRADFAATVKRLRRDPDVLFAEPLGPGP